VKFVLGIALALGLATAAYGAAETLVVTSGALQSGSDTDLTCDADGVTVNFSALPLPLETANVTGIDNNCDGEEILVEVLDGGVAVASGSGTIPVDASTAFDVTLTDTLAGSELAGADEVRVTIVS